MPKLIMTVGLPASGKTTFAKEQVLKSNGKTKRVNKDDLRAMIDANQWSKANEKEIIQIRNRIIEHYLFDGFSVIVDDTNLAPKHEKDLEALAETLGADFEVKSFLDVPLTTCIARNAKRENPVPENSIRSMFSSFIKKKEDVVKYSPQVVNEDLPFCLILDIDGTIAHMKNRSPHDYSQVHTDIVDDNIAEIVRRYAHRDPNDFAPDTYIIVVSGRTDDCKDVTEKWLQDNRIPYDEIHMRKTGDNRNDAIVKEEIYNKWIKNRYNVRFVLDDRNRVVDKWRELGLKCLQVETGDF